MVMFVQLRLNVSFVGLVGKLIVLLYPLCLEAEGRLVLSCSDA